MACRVAVTVACDACNTVLDTSQSVVNDPLLLPLTRNDQSHLSLALARACLGALRKGGTFLPNTAILCSSCDRLGKPQAKS